MSGKLKLSLLIFVISIIMPVVAYKIKVPKFLTSLESQISEFHEPVQMQIALRGDFNKVLSDPFKLSEKTKIPESKSQDIHVLPILSMIYEGKGRYAIIGDSIIKEGDRIGNFKVLKIFKDRVLLMDKKGERQWLKLQNY
jgi:hypothetical protein